jgi:parallel beta-helix repeat protein
MLVIRGLLAGLAVLFLVVQMGVLGHAERQDPEERPNRSGTGSLPTEWHEPIWIRDDDSFTSENGVVNGTGTASDPYIIAGWNINTSDCTGIRIEHTVSHFIIRNCYIHGNRSNGHFGIYLANLTNGIIDFNYISENYYGIYISDSSEHEGCSDCVFTNNSIVSNSHCGIEFTHILGFHAGNTIAFNNISDNWDGISAIMFKQNNITFNRISNNKGDGIVIGMCMGGGGENLIHHNNFICNNNGSKQGYDGGAWMKLTSLWNDSSGGNYWSDWTGPDADGDGIVDKPYEFDYHARDYLPLAGLVEDVGYQPSRPQNPVVAPDRRPPDIFDLRPVNSSRIEDQWPLISANYSDDSGIDLQNMSLILDGIDVTPNATTTNCSIYYSPQEPLSEGIHAVQLTVADNSSRHNPAMAWWTFSNPDLTPPIISALRPADSSWIEEGHPVISANFSDESGIYPSSVQLLLDSIDVTGRSSFTAKNITYIPPEALEDGNHTAQLTVADGSSQHHPATARWNFTTGRPVVPPATGADLAPPRIFDPMPENASQIGQARPIISASFSDDSGIDLERISLVLDEIDITPYATITESNITYVPHDPLGPGDHAVYLQVPDLSKERNFASTRWTFSVKTPAIVNPSNESDLKTDSNWIPPVTIVGLALILTISAVVYDKYRSKE